jgi:hypothetical protein
MTEIFLALAVGIAVGIWVTDRFHRRIMRDFLEVMQFNDQDLARLKQRLHQSLTEEPQLDIVEVKLEQHSGTILAFRKDTDQFLGQGSDREALIARLTENLTPCRVIIAQEDGADLLQKNNT